MFQFSKGPDWTYKVKLEGYRAVAVKSDRGVNLFSRRRKSLNHQYPYLVKALGLPCLCQGCPPAQPRFLVTQEWSVFCRCKSEDLPDCRTFGPPYSFPRLIGFFSQVDRTSGTQDRAPHLEELGAWMTITRFSRNIQTGYSFEWNPQKICKQP